MHFNYRSKHKHNKSCFVNARILLESFYKKREKIKKENEKVANRKLGKVGNLGNLGKVIPSFLVSEFSILPYSQNRKLGFKNLGKRCPRFPSFRPDPPTQAFSCNIANFFRIFFQGTPVNGCFGKCNGSGKKTYPNFISFEKWKIY